MQRDVTFTRNWPDSTAAIILALMYGKYLTVITVQPQWTGQRRVYVSYYLNAMWCKDKYSRDAARMCDYFLECVCCVPRVGTTPQKCWRKNLLASYVREKEKSTQICLVLLPGISNSLLIMAVGGGMWHGYHYQHIRMTRQALYILTLIHMAHQWQSLKMLSVLVICWAFISWTILRKSSTNHYKFGHNHHWSHWHEVFLIGPNC